MQMGAKILSASHRPDDAFGRPPPKKAGEKCAVFDLPAVGGERERERDGLQVSRVPDHWRGA